MEPVLIERYEALFLTYRVGQPGDLAFIKRRLVSKELRKLLRPDAALLLLSLYDQMILRPYTGDIKGLPLPVIARNRKDFSKRVRQSFTVISRDLKKRKAKTRQPLSSHQVLRAILRTWPKIKNLFGWA
jgi:hypothetical protein